MSLDRVQIVVSESGSRVVKRNLGDIGKTANASAQGANLLRSALLAVGGTLVVRQLLQVADAFTNLQNRIRLVTNGVQELNTVTDELLGISNRTRSAFTTNAELFNRLALSTRELGTSQKELLQFTESLNQAIIISGASSTEAAAGLLQLSQGLASGALRGDELRSVLEQLPTVADVIAKQMGVTRGQLRQLGQDGAITADIILKAFAAAREELAGKFARTTMTVGQAVQVLKNQVTVFIGRLNEGTGVTQFLNRVLISLATNIDTVARVVGAAGLTAALFLSISAMKTFIALLAANPLGLLVVGLTMAISLLATFSDKLKLSNDRVSTLADFGQAAFERIAQSLSILADVITTQFGGVSSVFDDFEFSIEGMIRLTARGLDGFVGLFRGAIVAVSSLWGNLGPGLLDLTIQMMNGIIGVVETAIDGIIALFKTMADIIGNIIKAFTQSFEMLAQATQAALSGHVDIAGHIADNAGKVFNTRMQIAMTDLPGQLGRNFEDASESDLLPRIDNVAKGAATRLRDGVVNGFVEGFNEVTVFSDSVNAMFDRADEIARNRTANLADGMGSPAAAVVGGAPTPQGAQPINQFEAGIADAMTRISKEVSDTAGLISDSLVGAFNNAEDALVGFVKTGKLDFSSLVDGMIEDLARLAVRMAMSAALNAIFPGGGGIVSAFGGARATGGPVEPGKSYLVGENGPETFSPGMAGTVSPMPQAPAEQAPANITIINVDSEEKIAAFLRSTAGQRIILNANGGKSER